MVCPARRARPYQANGRQGEVCRQAGSTFHLQGSRPKQRRLRYSGQDRRILERQRADPSCELSLLLCRPAVESGGALARRRDDSIWEKAEFTQRKRRVRPDVGLVYIFLAPLLPR